MFEEISIFPMNNEEQIPQNELQYTYFAQYVLYTSMLVGCNCRINRFAIRVLSKFTELLCVEDTAVSEIL